MTTNRTKRRKRILINWIARKMRHRHVRTNKLREFNRVLYPYGSEGWGFSEEKGIIDEGGLVILWPGPGPSKKAEKRRMQEDSFNELRLCKPVVNRWGTRHRIVRMWPENMVKLNWTGELVPWDSIKDRVKK